MKRGSNLAFIRKAFSYIFIEIDKNSFIFGFFHLFAATWVVDTFFSKYATFLNEYIPLGVRAPLAVLHLIGSGYLAKKGLAIVFGEKIEKPAVIRKSVFGAVRHPIYLGEILFFLCFLGLTLSLAATAVWVVAVAFLHS